MTERDHFVHVSGHPARDELTRMYQHVRPSIAIPVHGELRHMAEHARLAHDCQVAHTIVGENGSVMRIGPGEPGIIDHVYSGRLALEGNRVVPLDGELIRGRKRALWNGTAVVTVVVDKSGKLVAAPVLTTTGVLEDGDDDDLHDKAIALVKETLLREPYNDNISEAIRIVVRRMFREQLDKKPITQVHFVEV